MYTRNFSNVSPPEQSSDTGIPVQTFADSFAVGAFMKEKSSVDESRRERNENNVYREKVKADDEASEPLYKEEKVNFLSRFQSDDLILLGLLFLFLSDRDKENDQMIPILLAILLLF